MAIIGVLHTGLTVENLDRSLDFYAGLLGMTVMHTQTGDNAYTRTLVGLPDAKLKAALLRFESANGQHGHVIELIEYLQPKGRKVEARPCDVASAHLAFMTDDCIGMYERLSAKGVRFVNPPVAITAGMNKGGYGCYLKDPDGFTLEFLQPPPWRLAGLSGPEATPERANVPS